MTKSKFQFIGTSLLIGCPYAIQINEKVYVSPAVYSFITDESDTKTRDIVMNQVKIIDIKEQPELVNQILGLEEIENPVVRNGRKKRKFNN